MSGEKKCTTYVNTKKKWNKLEKLIKRNLKLFFFYFVCEVDGCLIGIGNGNVKSQKVIQIDFQWCILSEQCSTAMQNSQANTFTFRALVSAQCLSKVILMNSKLRLLMRTRYIEVDLISHRINALPRVIWWRIIIYWMIKCCFVGFPFLVSSPL